jgi:hypothetical protein
VTRPEQTGGGLADTLDILLGKGLVIAGVDTYIRYLEAMQRLQNTTVPGQISQGLGRTTGLLPPPPPTPAVAVPPAPVIPVEQP